jgi:hypothetical protein
MFCCRSLFLLLSFFFCSLYFRLSFFDLRFLITPLISSSFSSSNHRQSKTLSNYKQNKWQTFAKTS